jgi:hypothetical protein
MELKDIIDLVHTGGNTAMIVLLYLVYQNGRIAAKSLETLKAMAAKLEASAGTVGKIETKVDTVHDAIVALPLNILRGIRK